MCVRKITRHPMQGVYLSLTQCFEDMLQIHSNPDQNKAVTENE